MSRAAAPVLVDCPLCGSSARTWLHESGDRWMGGPGTFRYARCAACGHAYLGLRPPPDEMSRYYPTDYIPRGRAPAAIRRALRRHDLARRVRLVHRWAERADGRPGRVLDVGCATGDFLVECRAKGLAVAGVEPAPWAARLAAARGLPVWPTDLAGAALPAAAFDVVTLWDVIEHLEQPVEDLRRIARALRPGGHLVVGTPVEDGWDARAWGRAWAGWDTPRHLSVFSTRSLERALEATGYRVLWKGWVHEGYLISALSLTLIARERLPGPVAAIVRALLHARPVREAMRPVFRALDERWGGSAITVLASRAGAGS